MTTYWGRANPVAKSSCSFKRNRDTVVSSNKCNALITLVAGAGNSGVLL